MRECRAATKVEPMPTTVIKNARIVTDGRVTASDLKIRDGRIDTVAPRIDTPAGAVEIDAAGAFLLPGMIDDQVHFREPGFEHKGTIATESRPIRVCHPRNLRGTVGAMS